MARQFASATGGTKTATATPERRKFASAGGGSMPKPEDLLGALLMLRPERVEEVKNNFDKNGEKPFVDRLTADTVVLDGEFVGEYDSMWWGQNRIVGAGRRWLKKNDYDDADAMPILGRLARLPLAEEKDLYPNGAEDIEAAYEAFYADARKNKEPKFAWGLVNPTTEDEDLAFAHLDQKTAKAPAPKPVKKAVIPPQRRAPAVKAVPSPAAAAVTDDDEDLDFTELDD